MAEYIRVRRYNVSQDSFERTKGLAMEQAQDEHTQMLVCKVVGIVKTQEPVYEPLEEPEPPKPRRKVLDVELEQRDSTVMATVNHVDPKLVKEAMTLIHGGVQIRTDPDRYTAAFRDELIIGGKGGTSNTIFPSAADASSWIAEVHRLLAIINANEPQEGGEA
jgi:hypothetical protein